MTRYGGDLVSRDRIIRIQVWIKIRTRVVELRETGDRWGDGV